MSFILQPGTIPHIQHLYQPSKDWDIGSGLAIELLKLTNDSIVARDPNTGPLNISYKIDDKVSLKVAKIGGEYYVGYKGLNSPFLDTNDQIDYMYADKPYIAAPLKALLRDAEEIIPEHRDNIEVQIGILWYTNVYGINRPHELTPNVVTYRLKNMRPTVRLIISVVSATKIVNNALQFERNLTDFMAKGSSRVFVLDTKIDYSRSGDGTDNTQFIELISRRRTAMLENKSFDLIAGYEELLQTFFNACNRNDWIPLYSSFVDWFKEVYIVKVVTKLKKETNQRKKFLELNEKLQYIVDQQYAFSSAINLANAMRSCSLCVLTAVNELSSTNFSQGKVNEGLVLTYPYNDADQIIFKIVPIEFSKANFEKNKDLYK